MINKTMRACQACGEPFYGSKDHFYCPSCAKEKKLDTVIKIRTCQDCNVDFYGGPRAKRCPGCAQKAQKEINRLHKKKGPKRPLGSTDKCQRCSGEYIVKSGRQKYCSKCQREASLEWQREHKRGYDKASGQNVKKRERRNQTEKICVYCLKTFVSNRSTNVCSDYCREEQKKITQCKADMKRGLKRDYDKYISKRYKYRVQIENKNL